MAEYIPGRPLDAKEYRDWFSVRMYLLDDADFAERIRKIQHRHRWRERMAGFIGMGLVGTLGLGTLTGVVVMATIAIEKAAHGPEFQEAGDRAAMLRNLGVLAATGTCGPELRAMADYLQYQRSQKNWEYAFPSSSEYRRAATEADRHSTSIPCDLPEDESGVAVITVDNRKVHVTATSLPTDLFEVGRWCDIMAAESKYAPPADPTLLSQYNDPKVRDMQNNLLAAPGAECE